jgi:trk system potassium uptake protein
MERYAVIGLGRFGSRLATLLADAGAEVIAIDRRENLVEDMRDVVTRAVRLDCTDADALRSQGIDEVDVAVVGIGTAFEDALLATVLLKKNFGVPRVISRATSTIRATILSQIGADEVVNPERESAERWRTRLIAPRVMERIELADDFSFVQVQPPESFIDKSLGELDVRKSYQVQVVAIRRTTQDVDADGKTRTRQFLISVPMAETVVKKGDVLLMIGNNDALHQFGT